MLPELELPRVQPSDLHGCWHIVRSNFPMWADPRNTAPTFNYGPLDGGRLSDEVRYLRDGKPKVIRGLDTPDRDVPAHFTWRGTGVLGLLRSEWYVVALEADLATIFFTRTWFTPEGMDVIARDPAVDPARVDAMLDPLAEVARLREHVSTLRLR